MGHLTGLRCSSISLTWTADKDVACTSYDLLRHHRTPSTCYTKHVMMVLSYAVLKRLLACASDTLSRKHSKHSAFHLWLAATDLHSGKEFKLLLQQLTVKCCSVHGWSLNIPWSLYMWQMVPMLNLRIVQNWEFPSQMMHKQRVYISP
jgi:hypothetical protein